MKVLLQSEASECALVSLAMICSAYDHFVEVSDLRRRFQVSLNGAKLEQLIRWAELLNFSSRPVRLELEELDQLQTPCILHWNMNHMVVFKGIKRGRVIIADPAIGLRRLTMEEVSRCFTGVALELTPNADFEKKDERRKVPFRSLTGKVLGLKRSLAQILVLSLTLQVFAIAGPLINEVVVDDVFGGNDRSLLPVLILGFALLVIIQSMLSVARGWMIMTLGQNLGLQWTGNVFAHLMRLPYSYFEKRHLGDILSRFGSIGSVQSTLSTRLVSVTLDVFMALISLAMMLMYSTAMSTVAIAATLCYLTIRVMAYRPYREAARERLTLSARASSHFLESLRAILPIKLYGRENERMSTWQNLRIDVQNRDIRTAQMNIGFSAANTLVFGIQDLVIMWMGATAVMDSSTSGHGKFTIGMFFAFTNYAKQFVSRAGSLIDFGIELKMLNLHSDRLADIVLEKPEALPTALTSLSHLQARIDLKNVSFRYGEGEPWVLKDVSLTIEQGEHLAFVGRSGSGKSTLLKLILGLVEPTEGEVSYGGVNIRQLGLSNYRRLVGTVMQEDALLSGSIADNISFFDRQANMDEIIACATKVALIDEINRMPMGMHTLVGDLGSTLSGGQKQRLLLARALFKNPSILALDEATSHLDIANEKLIVRRLADLNLIRIVIAHRPETIAAAGRIVRIDKGRLIDEEKETALTIGETRNIALVD